MQSLETIILHPDGTYEFIQENEEPSKVWQIAEAILSYTPIIGTGFGIYHACKTDESTTGWQIAKIVTQIFSFLILPQIGLAMALIIKRCIDNSKENYVPVDDNYFKNLNNNNDHREVI